RRVVVTVPSWRWVRLPGDDGTARGGRLASAAREVRPRPGAIRLAWALCVLSVALALASVALAAYNGEGPAELVTNHHAIGILTALAVAPIGALIVVGDRRHLLAWLFLVEGLSLAMGAARAGA